MILMPRLSTVFCAVRRRAFLPAMIVAMPQSFVHTLKIAKIGV